ncbi:hypothetical protein I551_7417 [Mycobacterium ulcerans str. Harvey]|uniref:Uncharacterized protein n=1 Tax=Mycobacterium ulcerans str. Harvey TaxID=1299332 RepID=A0ABN0QNF7_MYCUL|nr:hypothetical protein I551_7417 [Mycobacterium ulcerans str. Harvey]
MILVIVFSLVLAGVIASELYARHVANGKVAAAVACEVKDKATASFGVAPCCCGSWQPATSPTSRSRRRATRCVTPRA